MFLFLANQGGPQKIHKEQHWGTPRWGPLAAPPPWVHTPGAPRSPPGALKTQTLFIQPFWRF